MTQDEVNYTFELHDKWLVNRPDGVRADFRNADLRGLTLPKAVLGYTDFTNANLSGMDLKNKDMQHCDFSYADMSNCQVNQATLSYSVFKCANLEGVNLDRIRGLESCTGNGKQIKAIQISDLFDVVYTKTHIWIGCYKVAIEDWAAVDLYDPAVCAEHLKISTTLAGTRGLNYARVYAEDYPHLILRIVTDIEPAI